jgi:putative oxidoreductase
MTAGTAHRLGTGPAGFGLLMIRWLETIPSSLNGWSTAFWELGLRVGVALVFFHSGETKVASRGWWDVGSWWSVTDTTVLLFTEEYKVPVLPPEVAASLATTAEHVAPVMLILGLGARLGAAVLLGMTLVIQIFVYPSHWHEHLLWAAPLFYVLVRGPGRLSGDHLIRRSQAHSRTG